MVVCAGRQHRVKAGVRLDLNRIAHLCDLTNAQGRPQRARELLGQREVTRLLQATDPPLVRQRLERLLLWMRVKPEMTVGPYQLAADVQGGNNTVAAKQRPQLIDTAPAVIDGHDNGRG